MMQAVLVGLTVFALEFIETWCSYPMTTRPLIVGTAIGIVLGDVATGVTVGASLELVFMGVMAIAAQFRRMPVPVPLSVPPTRLFWVRRRNRLYSGDPGFNFVPDLVRTVSRAAFPVVADDRQDGSQRAIIKAYSA